MDYRKFSLETASGNVFPLTNPSVKVFATNPSGFGFTMSNTTTRLGDVDYLTSKVPSMLDKSFDIIFYGDSVEEIYRNYQSFVRFLNTDDTLYLKYDLGNIGIYRVVVTSSSISKSEVMPDDNALTCSLSLNTLTFWEDGTEHTDTATGSGTVTKTITVDGDTGTYMNIKVVGTMTNPTYSIENADGVYGRGKFTGTYTELEVIADPANETINLKNGNTVITNPYNYQDLSVGEDGIAVTFLNLKRGSNTFRFSSSSSSSVTITLKYRNRYVSV